MVRLMEQACCPARLNLHGLLDPISDSPENSPAFTPHRNAKMISDGRVAQLGEHLLCKQGVAGSSPATSTKLLLGFH
jgi:hypothetical protein